MTGRAPPSFTRVMTERDDLTDRLAALGSAPVPAEVRAEHLHAMRSSRPAPARRRFGRLAVAAAALVGFAAGSTGFAMAGALPGTAQGIAHDVLSVVQVDVPDRPRNHGACVSAAAKQHRGDEVAKQQAKEACRQSNPPGRPDGVGRGQGGPDGTPPGRVGKPPKADDGDPCTGRPPWAGRVGGPTAEEAQQRAACPPDVDDAPVPGDGDG